MVSIKYKRKYKTWLFKRYRQNYKYLRGWGIIKARDTSVDLDTFAKKEIIPIKLTIKLKKIQKLNSGISLFVDDSTFD